MSRAWWVRLALLAVALVVTYIVVRLIGKVDWAEVRAALGHLDWWQAPILFGLASGRVCCTHWSTPSLTLGRMEVPAMSVPRLVKVLAEGQPEQQVQVRGWVRTLRTQPKFSFIELNDGSCMSNLQVVADASVPGFEQLIKDVTTGASVAASGVLKASPGQGQRIELHAKELRVLGPADPQSYVLQKKRHSFEFLREIAHLRPRTNTFGAIARVRNALSAAST